MSDIVNACGFHFILKFVSFFSASKHSNRQRTKHDSIIYLVDLEVLRECTMQKPVHTAHGTIHIYENLNILQTISIKIQLCDDNIVQQIIIELIA